MRVVNGKMELRESDVRTMFKCLFGGPIPDNLSLEDAAQSCAFFVGMEYVKETLENCKRKST